MSSQIAYTRRQAAEQLGLSMSTIDKAIRSGDLRTVQPTIDGRRLATVLITHEELTRWING